MTKNKQTILNTRPYKQQAQTAKSFDEYGFDVINLPCIEIVAVKDKNKIVSMLNTCGLNDVVIFTSQHAVRHAFKLNPQWDIKNCVAVIAVGMKTAQTYEQNFSGHIWIPQQQNSSGVIELLKGFKNFNAIKLITAEHGRKAIQNFAKENQIKLEQINVYKRQLPKVENKNLMLLEAADSLYILATSVITLLNLQLLLPDHLWRKLLANKVLCASSRIEQAAIKLGFKITKNMNTATPEEMLKSL